MDYDDDWEWLGCGEPWYPKTRMEFLVTVLIIVIFFAGLYYLG